MFRFTIRELLILTVTAGLAIGWWIDHRGNVEAASDARKLAFLSAWGPSCGFELEYCQRLEEKYGARRPRWRLNEMDEAKLGLDIEQ